MRGFLIPLGFFLVVLGIFASTAAQAQSFTCTAGRAVYTKKYADLFTTYPGTAATVESCAATCEQALPENRNACFYLGCGLACALIGIDNCFNYYTEKLEVDNLKGSVEKICTAEKHKDQRKAQEADLFNWSLAAAKDSLEGYQFYLKNCGKVCGYTKEANEKIAAIARKNDLTAWKVATLAATETGYKRYLAACSTVCKFKNRAEAELARFAKARDDKAWTYARSTGKLEHVQRYVDKCSSPCAYVKQANKLLRDRKLETEAAHYTAVVTMVLVGLPFFGLGGQSILAAAK